MKFLAYNIYNRPLKKSTRIPLLVTQKSKKSRKKVRNFLQKKNEILCGLKKKCRNNSSKGSKSNQKKILSSLRDFPGKHGFLSPKKYYIHPSVHPSIHPSVNTSWQNAWNPWGWNIKAACGDDWSENYYNQKSIIASRARQDLLYSGASHTSFL